MSYNYNPFPPRVWSRVQNSCTFFDFNSDYTSAYIPLTGQTVSQAQADYEKKQYYKGNILQYKGNSARLTKSQKYSQLARCSGPSRTKVFATQTQSYSNPNTTGLLRVNYETYQFPNQIVGAPNNISGPFIYDVKNPDGCSSNSVQDGGALVCGTYANQCTGEIYKKGASGSVICNPASASNVPGPGFLCWDNKNSTWFPKPRYVNNNSTDKWPVNYKGLVSAIRPTPPVIYIDSNCQLTINIKWTQPKSCLPISGYNIYINNVFHTSVPYTINEYKYKGLSTGTYDIYLTSISYSIESNKSNVETVYITL